MISRRRCFNLNRLIEDAILYPHTMVESYLIFIISHMVARLEMTVRECLSFYCWTTQSDPILICIWRHHEVSVVHYGSSSVVKGGTYVTNGGTRN